MNWLKQIFAAFTKKERALFILAIAGGAASLVVVMSIVFVQTTKAVPAPGGEYTEGAVGQPEYVNPVIASSPTDLALVKMVFANIDDIAQSVTSSPDMRVWTVRLKENLAWHDGEKLTSDDVIFTVQSIQDPNANSPLFQSWQGVSVSRVSELELQFNLVNPYAFFADNLKNLYVLPKHLFAQTPVANWRLSDYNLKPVGSGPYEFVSYDKNGTGFISAYHLAAWNDFAGSKPLIANFDFQFFNDENALVAAFNGGQIDGFGNASPQDVKEIERPYDTFSWRTSGYYAVFFNQSKNLALQDPAVRTALAAAIDRPTLVGQVLPQSAVPDTGPIPPDARYFTEIGATTSLDFASTTLTNAGWVVGADGSRSKTIQKSTIPLTVNLTVPQIDFLAATADALRTAWQAIGVQTNISMGSPTDILNTTIQNRDYEALLFGNVLGISSDLYSFWDSSQRFSPGLNLSIYSNKTVDNLIETARQSTSTDVIAKDMASAQSDIENDNPAIFLYSPDYIYVTNKNVQGITTSLIADPSDRFRNVSSWYMNTARVLR